jgi:hypothetical protein
MEDCAPFVFLGNWAPMVYICDLDFVFSTNLSRRNMFLKLRQPTPISVMLTNGLPLTTREMHLSFKSLAIINAQGL